MQTPQATIKEPTIPNATEPTIVQHEPSQIELEKSMLVIEPESKKPVLYSGYAFKATESRSHFCSNCGSVATGMSRQFDAGQLISSKFVCEKCHAQIVEAHRAKQADGNDTEPNSTDSGTSS